MNPQTQQLFVVIVHHGSLAVTERATEALWQGKRQPNFTVVVDHGPDPVVVPQPLVQVVRPHVPGGYGAGVNIGLGALLSHGAHARDIVAVMNNDVAVYPDSLETLQQWWRQQRAVGLVGVTVEEHGEAVYGGGYVNGLSGCAVLRRTSCEALHYIHGAFVAAPYEVWLALHGMPEEYFLYWEDVLLGRRATRRGYTLHYAAPVRVKHHTRPAMVRPQHYYLVRNGALFMEQEAPVPLRWWWYGYNRLRYLWHRLHRGSAHRATARALRDAIGRRRGPYQA